MRWDFFLEPNENKSLSNEFLLEGQLEQQSFQNNDLFNYFNFDYQDQLDQLEQQLSNDIARPVENIIVPTELREYFLNIIMNYL